MTPSRRLPAWLSRGWTRPPGSSSGIALRSLDPGSRAVVVLHYFLGLPLPEAAASLGIPLGTAKSRLHRSLVLMRSVVAQDTGVDVASFARGHLA